MSKITTLEKITEITRDVRIHNQKIGLITGCFDILHLGHIELFRFAKKHVDLLIVGLESDETIRLSKGADRPVHNLTQRSEVLSELQSVDYIFPIPITVKFADQSDIRDQYVSLVNEVHPDFLITSPSADKYWTQKRESLQPLGIALLECPQTQPTSTTSVLAQLKQEI